MFKYVFWNYSYLRQAGKVQKSSCMVHSHKKSSQSTLKLKIKDHSTKADSRVGQITNQLTFQIYPGLSVFSVFNELQIWSLMFHGENANKARCKLAMIFNTIKIKIKSGSCRSPKITCSTSFMAVYLVLQLQICFGVIQLLTIHLLFLFLFHQQ